MGTELPHKKGHSPQFSVYVYCGQTAGWIIILLGTEVGLVSGDIVLDGDPVPPEGVQPPIFGPCLLWMNAARWRKLQDGRVVYVTEVLVVTQYNARVARSGHTSSVVV